ncbi:MAG: asparaginase [Methyloceanibacter sp.]
MTRGAGPNPVLVDVFRGALVESRHCGAIAVSDSEGGLLLSLGDVERPVYPRSAMKALQAIPLVESGAADAFGLEAEELAVACASHSGDQQHLEAVTRLLGKAGLDESYLVCGAHWPISERTTRELLAARHRPRPIHNNCSGKHAGMLAAAVHLGLSPRGYEKPDHPLQITIARILSETCGVPLEQTHRGIDGCSLPTIAVPLAALARGFARLATGERLPQTRAATMRRLFAACFAAPVLVAGEGRFDTIVLRGLAPSVLTKGGAEGVHCAALPEVGLGIALKIDDGTKRGAERAMGEVLAALVPAAQKVLAAELAGEMHNWRGLAVGRIAASAELEEALGDLAHPSRAGSRTSG